MKDLLIYGASGLGSEILELVRTINFLIDRWNIIGFIDDEKDIGVVKDGIRVVGRKDFFDKISEPTDVVFGFASTHGKEMLYSKLKTNNLLSFPTIIHPSATVADSARIGEGTVITAMCFVSVNVEIGKLVFLNVGTQVGHDSIIGDFCSVMPSVNICGNVRIGAKSQVGVGAVIHQGLSVGENAFIGMGSVVIQDVKDNGKVFGNPAMNAP